MALDVLDTFAFESKHRARLCSRRKFDVGLAGQRGHFDFRAQRGLDKTDWHIANQVVPFTLKNLVPFDMHHHVKISRRPASPAAFAVASGAQSRTGVHARWNPDRDFRGALPPSGAV